MATGTVVLGINCTVKLLGRESVERPGDWDTCLLRFGLIDCG